LVPETRQEQEKSMHNAIIPIPLFRLVSCNAFLVRGRRTLLVDTGTTGSAPKILKAMRQHGIQPHDLSLIVLTHMHGDHSGSAAILKQATGAPIAMSARDAAFIGRENVLPHSTMNLEGRILERLGITKGVIPRYQPDVLWEGEASLEPYGIDGLVFPSPGHTPGHVGIHLASAEMIAGDAFAGNPFRAQEPTFPPFHHHPRMALESVKALLARRPSKIFTGHGGPFDPLRVAQWVSRFED
jgi:glyoxylase-like metal-dependent hydrolase (beta-lactamase superfamily II)